ncbi:hypothetical protein [Amycolatopsis eburnea]|uniref:Uncharacterized protein n=1 Tax=Amycolatopsis eburnea TaxID=2267691 RepID=A0A3R9EMC1_9PSEU|nr:hypothetical protein [Amycolatopsis eburnea]RSD11537.1 hypothetical protein EIY87_32635 [Amycolatopsis eburnea]
MGESEDRGIARANLADERDRRADERDQRADERERRADERERVADEREARADKREQRIRYYEARFEGGAHQDSQAVLTELDAEVLDRAGDEVARAKARLIAASDRTRREQAEIDREVAKSLRRGAASP